MTEPSFVYKLFQSYSRVNSHGVREAVLKEANQKFGQDYLVVTCLAKLPRKGGSDKRPYVLVALVFYYEERMDEHYAFVKVEHYIMSFYHTLIIQKVIH